MSVTLDSLIELLIPSRNYSPEQSYIFAVLLNIRIFISPPDLLQKVLQVYFNLFNLFSFFRFFSNLNKQKNLFCYEISSMD